MTKSYLVEFNTLRKIAFFSLQKIVLDKFPQNVFIWSAIVKDTCMQKINIGHRTKFRDKDKFFSQVLFPVRSILLRIFTSGVLHMLFLIDIWFNQLTRVS